MFPKFTIPRNNIMRKYILKFVQKIDKVFFFEISQTGQALLKKHHQIWRNQQPQYFLCECIWNQYQYRELNEKNAIKNIL